MHGSSADGDADELRLLSDDDTIINLRAYGGSLSFLDTKVCVHASERGVLEAHDPEGGHCRPRQLAAVIRSPISLADKRQGGCI